MGTTRTRVGRTVGVIIGLVLGGLIGAGLAFAGDYGLYATPPAAHFDNTPWNSPQDGETYNQQILREEAGANARNRWQSQQDSRPVPVDPLPYSGGTHYQGVSTMDERGNVTPRTCVTNGNNSFCN